jgi:uncharacterized alpha/beta hydrolase family protein
MKKLIIALLVGIFGVVLFIGIQYRQELKRQEHERAEQSLQECWQFAMHNGGIGAETCKALADQLAKDGN